MSRQEAPEPGAAAPSPSPSPATLAASPLSELSSLVPPSSSSPPSPPSAPPSRPSQRVADAALQNPLHASARLNESVRTDGGDNQHEVSLGGVQSIVDERDSAAAASAAAPAAGSLSKAHEKHALTSTTGSTLGMDEDEMTFGSAVRCAVHHFVSVPSPVFCRSISVGNPAVQTIEGCALIHGGDEEQQAGVLSAEGLGSVEGPGDALEGDNSDGDDPDDGEVEQAEARGVERDMVCVYGVPVHMTLAEFYDFTRCVGDTIQQLQIVRDMLNRETYSVLVKLRSAQAALDFRRYFHGRRFNSLEEDACAVALLERADFFVTSCDAAAPSADASDKARDNDAVQSIVTDVVTFPLELGDAGEPVVCPVCLDRIDVAHHAGITILCNHVFHFECISQWADSTCPVCRYIMQPVMPSECHVCGTVENLWICLICGHVGCGRYESRHAVHHFEQSGHGYALDVTTRRVWDYTADEFVHRLVQNAADGKLVGIRRRSFGDGEAGQEDGELDPKHQTMPGKHVPDDDNSTAVGSASAAAAAAAAPSVPRKRGYESERPPTPLGAAFFSPMWHEAARIVPRSEYMSIKLEEALTEYNYLLASQLMQQRQFFEDQLLHVHTQHSIDCDHLQAEIDAALAHQQALVEQRREADAATEAAERDSEALEQEIEQVQQRAREFKERSKTLLTEQRRLQAQVKVQDEEFKQRRSALIQERDQEIRMLEEQVEELTFHLKTQKAVARGDVDQVTYRFDENAEAASSASPAPASSKKKSKKKKKKKKKKRKKKKAVEVEPEQAQAQDQEQEEEQVQDQDQEQDPTDDPS